MARPLPITNPDIDAYLREIEFPRHLVPVRDGVPVSLKL